jgi:RecB family exonuclease
MPPQGSKADAALRLSAEQLWRAARHDFGGRRLARAPAAPRALPEPRAVWRLPSTAIARLAARRESATSFEHLADCQLRWIVRDVLGLRPGRFAEIPRAQQLVGTLAHAIAKVVFRPGAAPDPEATEHEANAVFDGLLRQIAAPLQQPEFAGELAAARASVPASLKTLAQMLRARNLEIVGVELDRERRFGDELTVFGRLDMVVRHPDQGLAVIDLKWTSSVKKRREELAEGRAIQLAAYGAIVDPDQAGVAPGAYYLLRQRRLFGPAGAVVADDDVDVNRSLGETWRDLVRAWRIWRDTAANGEAIATGLPESRDRLPAELALAPSETPCRYCEFIALCRIPAEVRS